MEVQRRPFLNAFAYTCLVVGSVVFSFPFLWMVCSSVKVDRELFPEKLEIFPHTPNAEPVSPFIDEHYYRYAVTEITEPHMDLFADIIREADYPYPPEIGRADANRQVTRGFAKKMEAIYRSEIWMTLEPETWDSLSEEVWPVFDPAVWETYSREVRQGLLQTDLVARFNTRILQYAVAALNAATGEEQPVDWKSLMAADPDHQLATVALTYAQAPSTMIDLVSTVLKELHPEVSAALLVQLPRDVQRGMLEGLPPEAVAPTLDALSAEERDAVLSRVSAERRASISPALGSTRSSKLFGTFSFQVKRILDEIASEETRQEIRRVVPIEMWTAIRKPLAEAVESDLRRIASHGLIEELFDRVYRRFMIGQVRIRAYTVDEKTGGFHEQELGRGKPYSARLEILTPETVSMTDLEDRGAPAALLCYDFTKGDHWRIEQTFETEFDVKDLHRIVLYFRPDDNWHRLYCSVEKMGRLYKPVQAVYPANFDWGTITWQEYGPDDETNKIKSWFHIREKDKGPQYESHPRKIKITFELRKSSQFQAWWGKIKRNYTVTLQHIPVWRYAATSFYLVILNVGLAIFSCSIVAYAIARLNWPGRDFCFLLMLATMMVPAQVTMIPGFLIWKHLGCYNTLVPLWLGSAFASPFAVFLLRQFLKGIPRDLEDSARIDGAGYFRIYWYIMFPLVKATLAVIAIGAFMGTWNNFMGPLIFVADQRLYPLAFGLYAFAVQVGNNPSLTMAGSFLMTVPIIFVFFFAQRYFIQGVTLTGMKG
jgi:multiple sugar transport system permease protein